MRSQLPTRALSLLLAALLPATSLLSGGCARISEVRSLRVVPLEKPRLTTEMRDKGYRLKGERVGETVRLEVVAVQRCATVRRQHADGFERTTREAVGPSLTMQWIMGGLFTVAGIAIAGYNLANPPQPDPDGAVSPTSTSSAYLQAGLFGGVGVGLLVGSAVQTASLGVSERPLGKRELQVEGALRICSHAPATEGKVRLTLPDGRQLVADVGEDGVATVPLPPDLEPVLAREGRRATVEVLGDWRSQARITL
ncbi:MAG: hypothetical protein H6747_10975 [Deltaproteobacteria bacterium]|nr:hypothetical protein [Deltaproteobacteria bacterium]